MYLVSFLTVLTMKDRVQHSTTFVSHRQCISKKVDVHKITIVKDFQSSCRYWILERNWHLSERLLMT